MKIRKLTSRLFPLLIVVFSGAGMMAQAATIFQSSGSSYIAFEAESTASLTNAPPTTWVVTNEASASAGLALYQAGANGTTSSSSFAYYALKFSVAGTYSLYYRWRADKAYTDLDPNSANSFRGARGLWRFGKRHDELKLRDRSGKQQNRGNRGELLQCF